MHIISATLSFLNGIQCHLPLGIFTVKERMKSGDFHHVTFVVLVTARKKNHETYFSEF